MSATPQPSMPALPTWREALRGSRVIPHLPWTARSRWRPGPLTLIPLLVGLWLFGTGEALLVASGLGNTPWVVLSEGVSERTGITIGTATFAVSLLVLLLWIPLRERPGLGTVLNIIVIATAIDVMLLVLPEPSALLPRLALVAGGIALVGIGSAAYLTAGMGPGPRDGWMTALHRRTGIRVGRVRLGIEIVVLVTGWLLGGTVGIATVLFAVLIGRSIAVSLALVTRMVMRPVMRETTDRG